MLDCRALDPAASDSIGDRSLIPRHQAGNVDIPSNQAPFWGRLEMGCRPIHPDLGCGNRDAMEAALPQRRLTPRLDARARINMLELPT